MMSVRVIRHLGTTRESFYGARGDFVEIDAAGCALPAVRINGSYGAPVEDVFNMDVTEVQSHLLSTMRYGSCQIAMSGLRKWVLHTNRICEVMVGSWVQRRQIL